MTFFIRFILVGIIIYLLVRSFARYFEEQKPDNRRHEQDDPNNGKTKGVSKEIGEYVDYEEVD
jgi:large-conductance mechanosensitive channel